MYQEQARARMQRLDMSTSVKHMQNTVDKETDAAEGRRRQLQGGEKTKVPRRRISESEGGCNRGVYDGTDSDSLIKRTLLPNAWSTETRFSAVPQFVPSTIGTTQQPKRNDGCGTPGTVTAPLAFLPGIIGICFQSALVRRRIRCSTHRGEPLARQYPSESPFCSSSHTPETAYPSRP